jgi:hypothetical protein
MKSQLAKFEELLTAAKTLVAVFDGCADDSWADIDCVEEEWISLRCAIEDVEGKSWEELVPEVMGSEQYLAFLFRREAGYAEERRQFEEEQKLQELKWREEAKEARDWLKGFLAAGEKPRAEIQAAAKQAGIRIPEMRCIKKRQENGVWFWRLHPSPGAAAPSRAL